MALSKITKYIWLLDRLMASEQMKYDYLRQIDVPGKTFSERNEALTRAPSVVSLSKVQISNWLRLCLLCHNHVRIVAQNHLLSKINQLTH